MRNLTGQREVFRRLQENQTARVQRVAQVRELGGLEPIEEPNFPPIRVIDVPREPRIFTGTLRGTGWYETAIANPAAEIMGMGGGVGVNLQGLRDVETFRVRERTGVEILATPRGRNTHAHISDYIIDWHKLFYNTNDDAKQFLKNDWNENGEFLEESSSGPTRGRNANTIWHTWNTETMRF